MTVPLFLTRCKRGAQALISPGRPAFIIIGAQKAGTTGLHRILRDHSQIEAGRRKEIEFFGNDLWYSWRYFYPYSLRFPARNHDNRERLFFEATPEYLYHPKAAERIRAYDPKMKLIVVLREPAARALSAWTMHHHHFGDKLHPELYDPRTFAQCVQASLAQVNRANIYTDKRGYIARGLYAQQLNSYFEVFDRAQILILEHQQLLEQHDQTTAQILDFLSLPREALPFSKANPSLVKPKPVEIAELGALRKFFKPHNEELFELLGREFGWNRGL